MKSNLERWCARFLEVNKISFQYETLRIPYNYEDKSHTYITDFFLPEYSIVLEVKPKSRWKDELVLIKRKAVIDLGYKFMFVDGNSLKNYKKLFSELSSLINK